MTTIKERQNRATGIFFAIVLLAIVIGSIAGCNSGEDTAYFTATFFDGIECPDYWMLERGDERYFVYDADMPRTPAILRWQQAYRPNDGVGLITDAPGLIVGSITVGYTTGLVVGMTYTELYSVALPNDWFDGDGSCILYDEPEPEPNPGDDDECDEDDDNGHGNDCDHDDEDNPGRGRGHRRHRHHGHDDD